MKTSIAVNPSWTEAEVLSMFNGDRGETEMYYVLVFKFTVLKDSRDQVYFWYSPKYLS